MDQTFLYEVRPRRVITGIHGVNFIRSPRAIYLTKEEVKICLQNGTVYRRFANLNKLEQVTVTNLDRLHREEYVSEDGMKDVVAAELSKDSQTVKVEVPPVAEEPQPPVVESKSVEPEPEKVENQAEPSDEKESEISPDAAAANEDENSGEEDSTEEESDGDESEASDDQVTQNPNQNGNNNHHNKKHRK